MRRIRVIPTLLLNNGGLVKSVRFRQHKYVGDPINAVKIFNEKEVDELVLLDITASQEKRAPNIKQISEIVSEAFMPIAYGGGITTIEQVKAILYEGVEKVVFNYSAITQPALITEAARQFGSSSVVVSVDVNKNWLGKYRVYTLNGTKNAGVDPVSFVQSMVNAGAGEIFLNSIDRDGTFEGYDTDLLKQVTAAVDVPVIACGGAASVQDFRKAVELGGASALAAGSMFVFQQPHRAVLITYPSQKELKKEVFEPLAGINR